MRRRFYNLAIAILQLGIKVHAIFNTKSAGRIKVLKETALPCPSDKHAKIIWIHCASHGEYIMATPLIQRFKIQYPTAYVAVSFFSYSGYKHKTTDNLVDWYGMLPIDSMRNARKWVNSLKPDVAIFVKYEYWWNYLLELNRKNCKIFVVAARFPEKPSGFYYRTYLSNLLPLVNHFFTANRHTESYLLSRGLSASYCGDPRADALLQLNESRTESDITQKAAIYDEKQSLVRIPKKTTDPFNTSKKTMVWGSIWPEDLPFIENMVADAGFEDWNHMIVPHEVSEKFTARIISKLSPQEKVSMESVDKSPGRVHVYDKVGGLRDLYSLARICYVGGGLGRGVHNVLEPAYWGKPVFFGPNYTKDPAALDWVKSKVCNPVKDYEAMKEAVLSLRKEADYIEMSEKIIAYFRQAGGATNRIFSKIQELSSSDAEDDV